MTETDESKNNYIHDFGWNNKDYHIHVSNYSKMLNELNDYSKRRLLIMDDAHRIEENFVNYLSYSINLDNYEDDVLNSFDYSIKELPNRNYKVWFDFIDYLGLKSLEIDNIKNYIKENPQNWICSYENNEYRNKLLFQPLDISDFTEEFLFKKGEICIFLSQTILNLEEFVKELGLDISKVKFIHKDFEFCKGKNKIYIRNSFDMKFDSNAKLLIPIIKEILERHENEKGLIHTYSSKYERFILKNINDNRLISYKKFNKGNKLTEFKNSKNSVLASFSLNESVDLKDSDCKFQIIIKQPLYQWDDRSRKKNSIQSEWYDYKKTINLIQMLLTPVGKENYCRHYILDENVLKSFNRDITGKKFIPDCFINSIADMDMENCGLISDNIKKQFGVHYLFDYITYKRDKNKDLRDNSLSQEILNYKSYNGKKSNKYEKEFNYFTEELMKAISELSNQVISDKINKLALVCVPSSTTERDKSASIRESINCIENWYNTGIAESKYKYEKEIINCSNLLTRFSNVHTAHKSDKRPSYTEHMNSIKCEEDDILKEKDVAFIILDDITTRGTIMNACEDILINNGVKQENVYKFALFKTLW